MIRRIRLHAVAPTMAAPMLEPPTPPNRATRRVRTWLSTWSPILPLLIAKFVVWLGFGALLPVMPLYFTEHGVDFQTLGIVIAAWPAARLVGEPMPRVRKSTPCSVK